MEVEQKIFIAEGTIERRKWSRERKSCLFWAQPFPGRTHVPMNPYKNCRSSSLLPETSAIIHVLLFLDNAQIQLVVVSYSDYTKVKAASQAKQNK